MKIEDLFPILAMIVYAAVVIFKQRRKSKGGEKKVKPQKATEGQGRESTLEKIFQRSPERSAPGRRNLEARQKKKGFFSKLGHRLGTFLEELEQQFKMEAEKARGKKLGSDSAQAMEQGLFKDFDSFGQFEQFEGTEKSDQKEKTSPIKATVKPEVPTREKQEQIEGQTKKKTETLYRSGVKLNLFPGEVRTAVVWSEILAQPLSLRADKRPWEN